MHAHFPPFTKPEAAYDSATIRRDVTIERTPRDDLQSIMANLRADLTRSYENAKCRIDAILEANKAAQTVTPNEPDYSDNAYLERFGPNTLAPEASRHPMHAEADRILKDQPGDML